VDNLGALLGELGVEGESHLCHPQEDLCRSFGQLQHEQRVMYI